MISEGSCDTEGWSNDAENSALHHRNIKIYSNRKLYIWIIEIFHNITVLQYYNITFDQIHAALVSIRDYFQKHLKNLIDPKH